MNMNVSKVVESLLLFFYEIFNMRLGELEKENYKRKYCDWVIKEIKITINILMNSINYILYTCVHIIFTLHIVYVFI